jgi:hypothetical protein
MHNLYVPQQFVISRRFFRFHPLKSVPETMTAAGPVPALRHQVSEKKKITLKKVREKHCS